MAYDLVRQLYPGAPCALGARVKHRETGEAGTIAPMLRGESDRVTVRFDGRWPAVPCDPRALEYLRAPVVQLDGLRRLKPQPGQMETPQS